MAERTFKKQYDRCQRLKVPKCGTSIFMVLRKLPSFHAAFLGVPSENILKTPYLIVASRKIGTLAFVHFKSKLFLDGCCLFLCFSFFLEKLFNDMPLFSSFLRSSLERKFTQQKCRKQQEAVCNSIYPIHPPILLLFCLDAS